MRATAAAGVALTAYAASNVSEELDSLNMTANATLYTAAAYGLYSLYQTHQHKKAYKAYEEHMKGMDIDVKDDSSYDSSSDEESYEDEDYGFDSDDDADAELSQANVLNFSRR